MLQTLLRRPASASNLRPARRPSFAGVAAVESLEDRVVLSAAAVAAITPNLDSSFANAVTVENVQVVGDQLVANISFFGQTARAVPLNLDTALDLTDPAAPVDVLNLRIGAIDLNLLGLNVETSDICLDITADPNGGLLGGLVAGIANLLNDPTQGLDDLTQGQLAGLTTALNGVFDAIFSSGTTGGAGAQQVGGGNGNGGGNGGGGQATDILNLSLGPVDLNLLGLIVELDDCDGGPVTVDITAERGAGNLLGNLLSSIAGLLDRDPGNAINARLDQIDRILSRAADDLLDGRGRN